MAKATEKEIITISTPKILTTNINQPCRGIFFTDIYAKICILTKVCFRITR